VNKLIRLAAPTAALTLLLTGCSGGDTDASSASVSNSSTVDSATSSSASSSADAALVDSAVTAANAFLDSLDSTQRDSAVFDYEDLGGKEGSWSNFPSGAFQGRQGVMLGDLDETQRQAALAVVDSVLSDQGMEQVREIMTADDWLGGNSATTSGGGGGGGVSFGSDNYYLAIYGDPSADSPWTLQFGGHHMVIHVTVGGGVVSASPMFTGVEPTTFTLDGVEYSPMVEEADAVFGLLGSLTEEQLATAKLSGIFDDLVMGPGADTGYPTAEGIPYTELTPQQQETVRTIIGLWVEDADPAVSDPLMTKYLSQLDQTVIGWSGSTDPAAVGSYLRIDGPSFWLEYLNAKSQSTADAHYHTVYRDKEIDYGTGTSA